MVLLRLFLIAVLMTSSTTTQGQSSALINADSAIIASLASGVAPTLGLGLDPKCSEVTEAYPPFYVANPPSGSVPTKWDTAGGGVNGYLPKGSLVEVDSSTIGALVHPLTELVGVRVLSVPDRQSAQMDSSTKNNQMASYGDLPVVKLRGARGHVRFADLANMSLGWTGPKLEATFQRPGQQVFFVRKNTPFFNYPQLQGKAVRLKQRLGGYQLQKCCPQGTSQGLIQRAVGAEVSRDPNCTYSPIFDLLMKGSDGSIQTSQSFTMPGGRGGTCENFIGSLSPVADNNVDSILNGLYAGDTMSSDFVDRLTDQFRTAATKPRTFNGRSISSGPKAQCRTGVREVFENLGLINPDNDRGVILRGPPPKNAVLSRASTYALAYKDYLPTQGFTDATGNFTSTSAPIGCALIYGTVVGGRVVYNQPGHIEVKIDNNSWCSDYCTDHPRDSSPTRRLVSIMCPPAGKTR